jgi:hypothetical protein
VTAQQIIISVLVSLCVNEFLGLTDWLARRIVRWAARRWETQTGHDHVVDWLEDLEQSPGRLLRVFSASWLLLGTFVSPESLTFGLPSLWRVSRPVRMAVVIVATLCLRLIPAYVESSDIDSKTVNPFYQCVLRAASLVLPPDARSRYLEEWTADLFMLSPWQQWRWVMSIASAMPRLAIATRLRRSKP